MGYLLGPYWPSSVSTGHYSLQFDYISLSISEKMTEAQGDNPSKKIKIVLLGDRAVGKSSLIRRFMTDHFQEFLNPTVGVDFMTKKIKYEDTHVKLELWDTAGQEKYRSLVKGYLRGADACVLVYDTTHLASYESLKEWFEIFEAVSTFETFKVIVGNKCDLLEDQAEFTKQKNHIKERLLKLGSIKQFSTSAKTGQNIDALFEEILQNCWNSTHLNHLGTLKTMRSIAIEQDNKITQCCEK